MAVAPLSPEGREKMLNSPAAHPPPGLEPNFDDPWSMATSAEAALHCLYALSTVIFFIKMYGTVRIERKMLIEDYVLATAWLQYTPLVVWGILILLLKTTILLQYLRVFVPAGTRNITFWATQIVLYTNIAYYVAFTFIQIFSCSPRAKFWDKTIMEGHCIDIFAVNVSGAVVCLVSDLAILLIPQRVVIKLNLPKSKIIGLCALFTIGIFACVTSAVRVYYNVRLWQDQTDVTHQLAYMSFWGTAQLPAGFLVTCLPGIPKVVNYARTKPWCIRLETLLRSVLRVSSEKVHTNRQIITIGGGAKKNQKAAIVSDVEFRDLMGTDQMSLSSTSHVNTVARSNFRDEA